MSAKGQIQVYYIEADKEKRENNKDVLINYEKDKETNQYEIEWALIVE